MTSNDHIGLENSLGVCVVRVCDGIILFYVTNDLRVGVCCVCINTVSR